MRHLAIAAAAAAVALATSQAHADTVMFQCLGLFSAGAPTTSHSVPKESFTFSFDLQDPGKLATGPGDYVTPVEDFSFTLNGVDDSANFQSVDFTSNGFILTFAGVKLKLVGADLLSDGMFIAPTAETYSVFVITPPSAAVPSFARPNSAAAAPTPMGSAMVVTTLPAVPEPATWALLITGFAATGAALRRRRPASLA